MGILYACEQTAELPQLQQLQARCGRSAMASANSSHRCKHGFVQKTVLTACQGLTWYCCTAGLPKCWQDHQTSARSSASHMAKNRSAMPQFLCSRSGSRCAGHTSGQAGVRNLVMEKPFV